jgi:hypothetical protein
MAAEKAKLEVVLAKTAKDDLNQIWF